MNIKFLWNGFDRTYEELKHFRNIKFSHMLLGFDRTYEELKPGRRQKFRLPLLAVLIVPMRN